MEVYMNQVVQDLLIPVTARHSGGLKVREHKTLGIYVEGLSKHFVDSYDNIKKKMEEGFCNRSVASTTLGFSSSRVNTIIVI